MSIRMKIVFMITLGLSGFIHCGLCSWDITRTITKGSSTSNDTKGPVLSSSYIPAAMQIIAHNTEYMKYVIKPPQSTIPTTTTIRPTPSHKPAVFAPVKPLGPEKYFSKDNTQAHYVEVQQQSSGPNYFDRYNPFLPQEQGRQFDQSVYNEVDTFVGKYFGNIFRLANEMDPENESFPDDETQVLGFSKNFEDSDSNYKYEILRQKKVPPTKAYVTLLSLYDLLNKEAKRMMLNKFVGYTEEVLNNLVLYSASTSSYQLRCVLNMIVENEDTKKADVVAKINTLIKDLDQPDSYINEALKDIPPLVFAH